MVGSGNGSNRACLACGEFSLEVVFSSLVADVRGKKSVALQRSTIINSYKLY